MQDDKCLGGFSKTHEFVTQILALTLNACTAPLLTYNVASQPRPVDLSVREVTAHNWMVRA